MQQRTDSCQFTADSLSCTELLMHYRRNVYQIYFVTFCYLNTPSSQSVLCMSVYTHAYTHTHTHALCLIHMHTHNSSSTLSILSLPAFINMPISSALIRYNGSCLSLSSDMRCFLPLSLCIRENVTSNSTVESGSLMLPCLSGSIQTPNPPRTSFKTFSESLRPTVRHNMIHQAAISEHCQPISALKPPS